MLMSCGSISTLDTSIMYYFCIFFVQLLGHVSMAVARYVGLLSAVIPRLGVTAARYETNPLFVWL